MLLEMEIWKSFLVGHCCHELAVTPNEVASGMSKL